MNYTVYLHRFPNNKVYIGITSLKPSRRWKNGQGYKNKQPLIYRAINKYGWNNIEHILLFENLSKEEAESKEIELIKVYDSTNPLKGYNTESGGSVNKHLSEATKEKLRQANLGKKHTTEEKKKMSKSIKKAYEEGRKVMTKEHLQKMQDARKYEFDPWNKGLAIETNKHILQLSKDGEILREFINVTQAEKILHIYHIYDACVGKRKTAGGFRWRYK